MSDQLSVETLSMLKVTRDRIASAEIIDLYRAFGGGDAVQDPAMGLRFVYAGVPASTVDVDVRRSAEVAMRWATDDNLLDYRPDLLWFVPETDADRAHVARYGSREWRWRAFRRPVDGWSIQQLGEVWVSAVLDAAGAVNTAAHEVRHLAQEHRQDRYVAELDAIRYAKRVEGKIHDLATA